MPYARMILLIINIFSLGFSSNLINEKKGEICDRILNFKGKS